MTIWKPLFAVLFYLQVNLLNFSVSESSTETTFSSISHENATSQSQLPINQTAERQARLMTGEKSLKILNGQYKPVMTPPPPPSHPTYNHNQYVHQQQQYPYPPQQPQSQSQFPQSPGHGQDLSGQASIPSQIVQQKPADSVPEVYVQIIEAIEKIVKRMDKMDTRVTTLENLVFHLTHADKKDKPKQGNCPQNFIKLDGIRAKCFHLSSLSSEKGVQHDWKSGHQLCQKLGGRLAELHHYDDFLRVSQALVKYSEPKTSFSTPTSGSSGSTDFWIGGINPGLIWIWSESGSKVGMDKQFWNENENASNAPGCLKLSYSHRLDSFFFKGGPCSLQGNVLCEIMDNSVSRALADFEHELNFPQDRDSKINSTNVN